MERFRVQLTFQIFNYYVNDIVRVISFSNQFFLNLNVALDWIDLILILTIIVSKEQSKYRVLQIAQNSTF